MSNEVLIITAIGAPDSPERETADRHLEIFKEAAASVNMTVARIDNVDCEAITPVLWEKLRTARVAIADLSHPNPNAAYELGVRHGLQMPVIIVTDSIDKLPFDFKDYNAIVLNRDGTDAHRLARRLRRPAREIENTVFREWRFRVVPPPVDEAEVNIQFYDTLVESLRSSTEGALLTASGFDDGSTIMDEYLRVSFDYALERPLTRIETSTPQQKPEWWRLLVEYLLPLDNFRLFVPINDSKVLVDLALVDWQDPQKALVEVMFHTDYQIGDWTVLEERTVKRAGYSLFAHSQQLAKDLFGVIREMKEGGSFKALKHSSDVDKHFGVKISGVGTLPKDSSGGKCLIFSYGPSMWLGQMKARAPSAALEGVGYLRRFSLSTTLGTSMFSSPTANLVATEDSTDGVYGVVYEIQENELGRLDFFEDLDGNFYERREVVVCREGTDEEMKVWTYIAPASEVRHAVSEVYLAKMTKGARESGIPESYIMKIRSFVQGEGPE